MRIRAGICVCAILSWSFSFLLLVNSLAIAAETCKILGNKVDTVRIGDTADKLFKRFNSEEYTVTSTSIPDTAKEIRISRAGNLIMTVYLDSNGRVFLIDVYDPKCRTQKNIGPGSTLHSVLRAYGRGEIDSTDRGYFVFFKSLPGILFLIEKDNIPAKLRNIPDDVFSQKHERQILGLKKARISIVEVSSPD